MIAGKRAWVTLAFLAACAPSAACGGHAAQRDVAPPSAPAADDRPNAQPATVPAPEPTPERTDEIPRTKTSDEDIVITKPEQAIERFQEFWQSFSSDPSTQSVRELVATPPLPPQAALRSAALQRRQLEDRMGTRSELFLRGQPSDLEGHEDVWVVTYDGMLTQGLGAALAQDGRVLLVWIAPEG